VVNGRKVRPTLERSTATRTRLRFELPPSVLPFTVEKAILHARVTAPGRPFSVSGVADDRPVTVHEATGPPGAVRVEITDPKLLRLDASGRLMLEIAVGDRVGSDGKPVPTKLTDAEEKWKIEGARLEVVGRTAGGAP
jgi:hypothetical protein